MNWTVAGVNTIPTSAVINADEHISIGAKWKLASRVTTLKILDASRSLFLSVTLAHDDARDSGHASKP
jgi:hypothetical protein